jgi:hypothetical protein
MGHYDADYEADIEARREHSMKKRRKAIDALDVLIKIAPDNAPDRFLWAMQDYQRWLLEGLEEWEADHIVKKLKGTK